MNRETPDLHFAAYVMTLGHTLVAPRREGKRVIFCFTMEADVWAQLLSDWANRTGMVIAFEYAEALRALKSLVHAV